MRDLRLLLPATFAWMVAWCGISTPGGAESAALVMWGLWAATCVAAALAVAGVLRRRRRQAVVSENGVVAPILRMAATALVVLSAGALVMSAATLELGAREASPLAAAPHEHRSAVVTIELTGAPRAMRSSWFAEGEAPPLRVEGRAVAIDGASARAVPVTTALSLPASELQLGARVTFSARVTALPAEEGTAFRLAA
ncbi:MAG: hypothetical protein ACRDT9_01105, partial [Agromyces sp.]